MALEAGGGWCHRGQTAADFSQFGCFCQGLHLGPAPATSHQRTGPDPIAALLGHRQGFTGEQGFIQPEAHRLGEAGIGRHPVPLLQPQQIAQSQLLGCNCQVNAITPHVGQGGGEAGQLRQGPVAALLLYGIQQTDADHKSQ